MLEIAIESKTAAVVVCKSEPEILMEDTVGLRLAVMVDAPCPEPVATPAEVIETAEVLEDDQVT